MKMFLLIILLVLSNFSYASPWNWVYVTEVHDGDTFKGVTLKNEVKTFRLAEIDCPELAQDGGKEAQKVLSTVIFHKQIKVKSLKKDRYFRDIARVKDGKLDINNYLISEGLCYSFKKYPRRKKIDKSENSAKQKGLGIWDGIKGKITPWDYRKRKK